MDAVRAHAADGGPGARRLQRFPDPVRSRASSRRADAQCAACALSAATCISGSSAPIRRSPAATTPGQVIRVPVAHGDGNYRRRRDHHAPRGRGPRRLPLRARPTARSTRPGTPTARPTPSPASSTSSGNVLGMMPHPENLIEEAHGGTDGRGLFAGLVEALARGLGGVNAMTRLRLRRRRPGSGLRPRRSMPSTACFGFGWWIVRFHRQWPPTLPVQLGRRPGLAAGLPSSWPIVVHRPPLRRRRALVTASSAARPAAAVNVYGPLLPATAWPAARCAAMTGEIPRARARIDAA